MAVVSVLPLTAVRQDYLSMNLTFRKKWTEEDRGRPLELRGGPKTTVTALPRTLASSLPRAGRTPRIPPFTPTSARASLIMPVLVLFSTSAASFGTEPVSVIG